LFQCHWTDQCLKASTKTSKRLTKSSSLLTQRRLLAQKHVPTPATRLEAQIKISTGKKCCKSWSKGERTNVSTIRACNKMVLINLQRPLLVLWRLSNHKCRIQWSIALPNLTLLLRGRLTIIAKFMTLRFMSISLLATLMEVVGHDARTASSGTPTLSICSQTTRFTSLRKFLTQNHTLKPSTWRRKRRLSTHMRWTWPQQCEMFSKAARAKWANHARRRTVSKTGPSFWTLTTKCASPIGRMALTTTSSRKSPSSQFTNYRSVRRQRTSVNWQTTKSTNWGSSRTECTTKILRVSGLLAMRHRTLALKRRIHIFTKILSSASLRSLQRKAGTSRQHPSWRRLHNAISRRLALKSTMVKSTNHLVSIWSPTRESCASSYFLAL